MDVETLGLETGKAILDGLEPLTDGVEMIESLLQSEVPEIVGAEFVAQVARELFRIAGAGNPTIRHSESGLAKA